MPQPREPIVAIGGDCVVAAEEAAQRAPARQLSTSRVAGVKAQLRTVMAAIVPTPADARNAAERRFLLQAQIEAQWSTHWPQVHLETLLLTLILTPAPNPSPNPDPNPDPDSDPNPRPNPNLNPTPHPHPGPLATGAPRDAAAGHGARCA